MAATNHSGGKEFMQGKKEAGGFGDFFECSGNAIASLPFPY
jgi:hypothetical protein